MSQEKPDGQTDSPSEASQNSCAEQVTENDSPPIVASHHVAKILDEVLENPPPAPPTKHMRAPLVLDIFLAFGLLFASFGTATGIFQMYLTHSAAQAINQQNYQAAIAILRASPMPKIFNLPGSDNEELLSKALYLDAMDKLDGEGNTGGALQELQMIRPGSAYFVLAQKIIGDNTTPADLMLEGQTEQIETNPPEKKQSLLDKAISSPD